MPGPGRLPAPSGRPASGGSGPAGPAPAPAPAIASALTLQRQAGNRAVVAALARKEVTVELRRPPPLPPLEPAMDRATPENRELAMAIDALAGVKDPDLVQRRAEVTRQLPLYAVTATERAEQARLRRTLQAMEYVADERRRRADWVGDAGAARVLEPVKPDWSKFAYVRRDPEKRRAWVRWLVEQRVREERSFRGALKVIRSTATYGAALSEIEDDLEGLKAEADAFGREFTAQARRNAERVLTGSLAVIDKTLAGYGLSPAVAHGAAREWLKTEDRIPAHHLSLDAAAMLVVDDARRADAVNTDVHWKARRGLGEAAGELKRLKQAVLAAEDAMWKRADETGGTAVVEKAAFMKAKDDLAAAWFAAERAHPVLAAYRGRRERERRQTEASPLATIDLGTLDTDRAEAEMHAVLVKVLPTIAHIQKAADKLAGGMSPLKLPSVVALTQANMFIPPGSIRAGVVRDLVAAQRREPWLIAAAGIALSLVTLVPTLGASLPMINVAAGALAAYSALHELEQYDLQSVLVDTDLDRARALSQADPSLAGFAWSLVGLGLEPLMALHALKKARELRGLVRSGGSTANVVDELDRIGAKVKGKPKLGQQAKAEAEEAERLAGRAPKAEPEPPATKAPPRARPGTEPPAPATTAKAPLKPPPVDPLQNQDVTTPVKQIAYATPEALREGVRKALTGTRSGRRYAGALINQIRRRLKDLSRRVRANRDLIAMLDDVYALQRDPKLIEDAVVSLWTEAAQRQKPVRTILEERMGGRFTIVEDELTRDVLKGDAPWLDHAFASDRHGAHTHLFAEYLIDFKLGAGQGRRFRQAIANAIGPDVLDAGRTKPFWAAVWDAVFDVTDEGMQINRPEVLGPILQEHLGLPRFKPRTGP